MNPITIGMFAHVDAGKTTFAEQLLYHTHSIRERGRVDHKDAYLDSHDIERARGITVFADQAVMTYQGSTYYLIDTPGHVDFSPEMERAVQVMDYAILVISAVEGIQGHTETVWQLLHKHRIPTFFFINKIDRVGAEVDRVFEDIRMHLTADACMLTDSFAGGNVGEALLEFMAERDETLLDAFLAGTEGQAFWLRALQDKIRGHQLFPCASGSALQDIGVIEFMDQLHRLTTVDYDDQAPFGGRVYKIRHDSNGVRLTYIKGLSGTLKVRDELCYPGREDRMCEKATRLLIINGSKSQAVDQVRAGDLFAVTGLSSAEAGQGIGVYSDRLVYELVPTLTSKVIFPDSLNVKDVLKAFQVLNAEDPSLNVIWEESLQEIHIHVMGLIQLEVLEQLAKERFQIPVSFGKPEILYKETILSAVNGYGHFEPLKHYAEVHLRLEPAERGSGITFENACHANDLSIGNQNLVKTHLYERDHHGLLTGMPLTDVRITLLTGAAHNEHTHGGDFREAAFRALRQGLEKAENVLLEPYYEFKIKVEIDHMGKVLSDIQRASGQFEPPHATASHAVITGRVPVATFMDYGTELASFTHGKGIAQFVFGGYDRCHNEQAVIERKNYRKDADPLYSSSSIFCAKGHGYTVAWDEAEAKMHLL
ncbi:TetM/TetW/TetO/TetS family tetracycline resistance ribosomal protection protein [Paenibacillus rhizovicinus]|uniref:TetM/TetW/TetO/TetS family tetracycline resistance ribosomal protection protein n=1 Tax=Paenibacillus rhizovicinus TaxID=2704463 RepID=A0A6C0P1E0_9BACL|nr:TetM/TetW/TetO/TetS family tetracycline resistance ribosomal protection protein [Paenibacillus rhizovicinus]QHW32288.1 TetM/TetW/TetO/TetS family tetracycline resistance ribosomal protection protein [Paenibacillus rhizovicinus]